MDQVLWRTAQHAGGQAARAAGDAVDLRGGGISYGFRAAEANTRPIQHPASTITNLFLLLFIKLFVQPC